MGNYYIPKKYNIWLFSWYSAFINGKHSIVKRRIIVYLGMLANWRNSRRSRTWLDKRRAHATNLKSWLDEGVIGGCRCREEVAAQVLFETEVIVKLKVSVISRYLPQRRNAVQLSYCDSLAKAACLAKRNSVVTFTSRWIQMFPFFSQFSETEAGN